MYQTSLPDEVNSSRPKGMLDRDLRTTLTVRGGDGHRRDNHQLSLSDQYVNCQRNKCTSANRSAGYTTTTTTTTYTQLKDAASLWQDRPLSKMHLDKKYPSSRGFYRSLKSTKFGHCLLVFLCVWLTTIHRTCAYPAMSDGAMSDLSKRCKEIKDALIKPIEQTNLTSEYIRELLKGYALAQFKKQPSELHAVWRHILPHFRYDANYVPNEKVILTADYDGEAEDSQLEHIRGEGIPTEDELRTEFQRIYVFLHTIKEVLQKILEDRRNNATQLLHDLNNDMATHENINSMFREQSKYNNLVIEEVSSAMTALNIPHPPMPSVSIRNINVEPNVGEWLTTREHLKVLRYMKGVYNTFNNRCLQ